MKYIIAIFLAVGLSCRQNIKSQDDGLNSVINDTAAEELNKTPKSVDQEFRTIKVDTLTEYEYSLLFKEKKRKGYNVKVDSSLISKMGKINSHYRNVVLNINDSIKSVNVSGLTLWFKKNKNGTRWLTSLSEGNNSIDVRLYTFDIYFNLIDQAVLTTFGGDEGYKGWSFGEFMNDSTYAMKEFRTGFSTDSIEYEYSYCLIIKSNGRIEKNETCQ